MRSCRTCCPLCAAALALCCGPAVALADVNYPVEGLVPGPLIGQDGWHVVPVAGVGDASGVTVDATTFSPRNGSTQSISLRGQGDASFNRVARALGQSFTTGQWRVGYDVYVSPREPQSPTNLVARTVMYTTGEANQIIQPFIQDGGNGLPAQNGFTDPDGLGGAAYSGQGLVPGFTYTPLQWYRFEMDMNFDADTITNFKIFDISSGPPTEVASNAATFYFRNDDVNYFEPLAGLGLGLDAARATEGFNVDTFSVTPVPEPASAGLLLAAAAGLAARRRRRGGHPSGGSPAGR